MADINADVRKAVELTEAQILAGGIKAGQSWQASDTKRRIMRSVDGLSYRYDQVATDPAILEELVNKQEKYNGFEEDDREYITATMSVLADVPQFRLQTSADVRYYYGGELITIPSGYDVTTPVSDVEGEHWIFLDELIDVQLDLPHTITGEATVVYLYYWNADDLRIEYSMPQLHGCQTGTHSHLYNHLTRGSVVQSGWDNLQLTDFTVGDGLLDSNYQFRVNSGSYFDEDIRYSFEVGQYWSPTYFVENGNIRYSVTAGQDVHFYHNGTAPQYNKITNGVLDSMEPVPDGKYFFSHMFRVEGGTVDTVSISGHYVYDSLQEARLNVTTEHTSSIYEYDILREMVYLGSVIFQYDTADFTNAYNTRVVEFASTTDGLQKSLPYYDGRYQENMPLLFAEPTSSETETFVQAWTHARYSAFYGAWATDTDAQDDDFTGATKLYIHRNAQDGTNMGSTLETYAVGDELRFKTTNGDEVTFTLTSTHNLSAQIYDWDITVDSVVGTFQDAEPCNVFTLDEAASAPTDFNVTSTDANVSITDQASYYTATTVVVAFTISVTATLTATALFGTVPAGQYPYEIARGGVVITQPTGEVLGGVVTSTGGIAIYGDTAVGNYTFFITYPRV